MSAESTRLINDAADRLAEKMCRAPHELDWMKAVCRAAAWAGVTEFLRSDVEPPHIEGRAA